MDENPEKIIETCRNEIDAIDREIFSLIKKREQLSCEIGRAKRGLLIPDRDFRREKIVFDRAIALAKELDLPQKFAVQLQTLFIEASLFRQEKDRIKNSFDQNKKSVLIVGGAGRLGKWLCHFFFDSGHKVSVIDLNHPGFSCHYAKTLDSSADRSDIIVVATPIRVSVDILNQIDRMKLTSPVIFDVSSVKAPIHQSLLKLKNNGMQVTSLHPMFGPSVDLLFGKHIIRTSLGVKKADLLVNEIFSATSLQVMDMSIDEHDSVMSVLLSFSHLVNIVFAKALVKNPFPMSYLEKFSSPTFSNLAITAKKVLSENPHLYYEIQALNPYTKNVYQNFSEAFLEIINAITNLDEKSFVAIMKNSQQFLASST